MLCSFALQIGWEMPEREREEHTHNARDPSTHTRVCFLPAAAAAASVAATEITITNISSGGLNPPLGPRSNSLRCNRLSLIGTRLTSSMSEKEESVNHRQCLRRTMQQCPSTPDRRGRPWRPGGGGRPGPERCRLEGSLTMNNR